MKRNLIFLFTVLSTSLIAMPASAQITVDGVLDAAYGAPIVVQNVQTQFGDTNGEFGATYVGGSELNAAYAKVENGRLFLMLTGNHESNFNKLDIFIDSVAGGENTLSGTPDYDFNPGGGWISSNLNGLTFDTGFEADYHLFSRWGGGGTPGAYEVDFVNRQGGGSAMVPGSSGAGSTPSTTRTSSGSVAAGATGPNASMSSLTETLFFGIDDTNALGVAGGTAAADMTAAAAVTTGMEFSISLDDLGSPAIGSSILISAMINNGDHNFLSNQILGGLPTPAPGSGQGNLGGDGGGGFIGDLSGVDFNQFAGNQFFSVTVVPEPSSLAVLGLGFIGLLHRRRR
jgi:hypothetical protein